MVPAIQWPWPRDSRDRLGYFRGTAWPDQACGAMVFTELGPNSLLPDRCDGLYCLNDPGDIPTLGFVRRPPTYLHVRSAEQAPNGSPGAHGR